MSQVFVEGLKTALYASQGVGTFYNAVGGRIYDMEAPLDAELPLCVYSVVSDDITRRFSNATDQRLRVQFDIYQKKTNGGEAAGDIEQLLYTLLERTELTVSGNDRGLVLFVRRGQRFVEEDAIRIIDEVEIRGTAF